MSLEIERKFLTTSEVFKKDSYQKIYIKQGFLNSHKERVVRIRIAGQKGLLTIKGMSDKTGIVRYEWEKEISLHEAEELLLLCEKEIIEKYRYLVKSGQHIFEVDEFLGSNKGLIIAEIELEEINEKFSKPSWLGKEVTGDIAYYNANLSKTPFCNWPK